MQYTIRILTPYAKKIQKNRVGTVEALPTSVFQTKILRRSYDGSGSDAGAICLALHHMEGYA